MARLETTQNAFTSGEWSPVMLGRTDTPRYQQAAERMENYICLEQGGITRRWGLRFQKEVKDSTKRVRLMSFRFSNSQTYLLELGNLYSRFYTQNGQIESSPGVALEAVTPWSSTELADLEWAQKADTAFVTHPSHVVYRIVRIASDQWKIQAAPFIVFPSAEWGTLPATNITLSAASGAITITSGAAAFLAGDVGRQVIADIGEATITVFNSTTSVDATATGFQALAYASQAWTLTESPKTSLTLTAINNRLNGGATLTLTLAGWRSTDVGKYVSLLDGLIEITAFSSTTVVTGRVREPLNASGIATAVVESAAWRLEPKSWNSTRGYPRAVALSEQRSVFAGTLAEPTVFWASPTGRPYDLSRGVLAASGMLYEVWGFDMSTIMHLVHTSQGLICLTASAEESIGTGNEDAMTPTNIRARDGSLNGSSNTRPVIVNNDVWFVQDGGTKVRALAFVLAESAYWSPDVTYESSHLFTSGVTEIAYSKDPHPIVYAVMNNGTMGACTASRQTGTLEHDVLAWAKITTDGLFESAATMRYLSEDQLWMVVNRTIGGVTKRYIERADWTLNTDSAVTGSGAPSSSWAGYTHLEGKTVDVVGDATEMAPAIVTGGYVASATATGGGARPVSTIEAGLHYDSTLKIPVIEPYGSSFGAANVRTNNVIVDLVDSIGLTINGDEVRWREFGGAVLGQPPSPVTGKKNLPSGTWDEAGAVTLGQTHPFRQTIRRVIRKYTVNEG